MDWKVLIPFIGLAIGCAMRTVGPYFVAGLQAVKGEKTWKAWPDFDASYLASLIMAIGAYAAMMLLIKGAWAWTLELDLVGAAAIAYTGQSLAREGQKGVKSAVAIRRNGSR